MDTVRTTSNQNSTLLWLFAFIVLLCVIVLLLSATQTASQTNHNRAVEVPKAPVQGQPIVQGTAGHKQQISNPVYHKRPPQLEIYKYK